MSLPSISPFKIPFDGIFYLSGVIRRDDVKISINYLIDIVIADFVAERLGHFPYFGSHLSSPGGTMPRCNSNSVEFDRIGSPMPRKAPRGTGRVVESIPSYRAEKPVDPAVRADFFERREVASELVFGHFYTGVT